MPSSSRLRQRQRDEIHPLIRALDARLGSTRSYTDIARETGLTNYQVGRLLGETLPSPNYLDLTRLIISAGMTPNEAARVVGLWNGPDYDHEEAQHLTKEEQRVIDLLRQVKLPEEERGVFRAMLETMLEAFAERLALSSELKKARATTRSSSSTSSSASSSSLYDDDEVTNEVNDETSATDEPVHQEVVTDPYVEIARQRLQRPQRTGGRKPDGLKE